MAALYAAFSRPSRGSLFVGLPLALAGLLLRGWAAGHLAKNLVLATSGPFAYTRNPLYLGSLTVAAGFAIAGRNLWLAALVAIYFLAAHLPVIGEEESHLRQLFPEYAGYASRVPRFLPHLSNVAPGDGAFQWSLYLRNREYQALAAYLVVTAWLISKA